jgi:hypothetical protein
VARSGIEGLTAAGQQKLYIPQNPRPWLDLPLPFAENQDISFPALFPLETACHGGFWRSFRITRNQQINKCFMYVCAIPQGERLEWPRHSIAIPVKIS